MSEQDAVRAARNALKVAKHIGVEFGRLGIYQNNAWVFDVPARPGWFYVRVIKGESVTIREALKGNVSRVPDLQVLVDKTPGGDPIITGIDPNNVAVDGAAAWGANVPEHAHDDPVAARRLLAGLVHPTSPASLSVRVEPFLYVYDGALQWFSGGEIDLTASVPGSSNERRLALVGVDPLTNALSSVDGDTYSIAVTLSEAQLVQIDPGNLVPLSGVNVFNGMSSVNKESQFVDARLLYTSAVGAATTGEIWLPVEAGRPSTTNGCATPTQTEYGTNDVDLFLAAFDASTDEFMQWSLMMPDSWDAGTVTFKAVWAAASSSGDVVWGLQGRSFANDDAIDQAWGTAQTVTDTLTATGDICVTAESSAITLAGTPAAGEFVVLRAYRDADAGGDTLAADAQLIGIKVYYTKG